MLEQQISKNKKITIGVIAVFVLFICLIGFLLYLVFFGTHDYSENIKLFESSNFWYMTALYIGSLLIYVGITYLMSSKYMVALNKGILVTEENAPELLHIVEDMAMMSDIPIPKAYIVDDKTLNAYASGRNPKHSSITVTSALYEALNREELEGVISHEMSHIKNYDIKVTTIVVSLMMFISFLAQVLNNLGYFMSWGDSDDDDNNGYLLIIASYLIQLIGVPIGMALNAFISRNRETLADVSGVELTLNPHGLISALKKIRDIETPDSKLNTDVGMVNSYMVTPKGFTASGLLDSHPPLDERIKLLEKIENGD